MDKNRVTCDLLADVHRIVMKKRVIVIGAGLGGISAAVSAAAKGCSVSIYEKNSRIGGKLNVLERDGFSFDMGPSMFTLPQYFESLFQRAGRRMADYFCLEPLELQWRNFFEDGTKLDLFDSEQKMKIELAKLGPDTFRNFQKFSKYSAEQYALVEKGYFNAGIDTISEMLKFYGPWELFVRLDSLRTMDKSVRRFFENPYLIDVFDFFIKYVGSSATRAPAFFNLLPHIQLAYQLWYVKGGMYNIARGFERLMTELDIDLYLGAEVVKINTLENRVSGIQLGDGTTAEADIVISNMEVIPTHQKLLNPSAKTMRSLEKFEPACSGLVIHLAIDRVYPELAHHNFFFSRNQRKHFDSVFVKKQLPDDPTLYVVAPTRTDATQAPAGCDNIKILPHIPHLVDGAPVTDVHYEELKSRVLDKLERMGLCDLRKHVLFEHVGTPKDIEENYASNRGSIYGVVSDLKKNHGFKAPKRSSDFSNLYFVGGSINPGGGMPMVVLCGQKAVDLIETDGHLRDTIVGNL